MIVSSRSRLIFALIVFWFVLLIAFSAAVDHLAAAFWLRGKEIETINQVAIYDMGEGGYRGRLSQIWGVDFEASGQTRSYSLSFAGDSLKEKSYSLFIPGIRQRISASLNDMPMKITGIPDKSVPGRGYSAAIDLDPEKILPGENILRITQKRENGWVSGYLSKAYLIPTTDIGPMLQVTDAVRAGWALVFIALRLLLVASVLMVFLLRRRDSFFSYLLAFGIMSSISMVFVGLGEDHPSFRIYSAFSRCAVGLLAVALACKLCDRRCRRAERILLVSPVGIIAFGYFFGLVPSPYALYAGVLYSVSLFILASVPLFKRALRHKSPMALVFGLAFSLTGIFGVHDILLALGYLDGVITLTPLSQFVILATVLGALMGWLAESLNLLDQSQAVLLQRLSAQEKSLQRMHGLQLEQDRKQTLQNERERLMHDLHDGISGNLVSILALSERSADSRSEIQKAARGALNDLHLVIESLDLGEGDLRFALVAFRDRIEPQIRRQGMELVWSMEGKGDVVGFSPTHGLSILRILQEAVTNAMKHGKQGKIRITGRGLPEGGIQIMVVNDIQLPSDSLIRVTPDEAWAVTSGAGMGIVSMEKRAKTFGGCVNLKIVDGRAILILLIPRELDPPEPFLSA